MRMQYLGTAAAEGWPALFCRCDACGQARRRGGKNIRSRASALVDNRVLIDPGPDLAHHALAFGLDFSAVDGYVVTHSHCDHFDPSHFLMYIEPFAHRPADAPPVSIHGSEQVADAYRRLGLGTAGAARAEAMEQRLRFVVVRPGDRFEVGGVEFTALSALHARDETCLIYLLERGGRRLLYANDTGLPPEDTWERLRGQRLDLVSFDCTMGPIPDGRNHMGLADNAFFLERLVANGNADADTRVVVTHFSHNGGLLHEELEAEVRDRGWGVAWDGMVVDLATPSAPS